MKWFLWVQREPFRQVITRTAKEQLTHCSGSTQFSPYTNTASLGASQHYTNIRFHQSPPCPTHTYAHTRTRRLLNGQRRANISRPEMSGLITRAFQQSSSVHQHLSRHTASQMWIKRRNRLTVMCVDSIAFQINGL